MHFISTTLFAILKRPNNEELAPDSIQTRLLADVVESDRISMPVSPGQFGDLTGNITAKYDILLQCSALFIAVSELFYIRYPYCFIRQIKYYDAFDSWKLYSSEKSSFDLGPIHRLVSRETIIANSFAIGSIFIYLTTASR